MNQIFTAGYAGHSVAQLKRAAETHNARVIDIRLSRRSMQPEWNEEQLIVQLGWRYVPVPTLGNLNYNTGKPIQIHNPKLGLDIVENLLRTNSLILLCGCRDYEHCHRAVVAQMLKARHIITQELAWPEIEAEGTLKALSIRQPWASLIIAGIKDIENREWNTNYRGRVLIHASKGMTKREYEECADLCLSMGYGCDKFEELQRGGIVGEAEIIDCVSQSKSPWFFGKHGFVLANAKSLPFVPLKGALGFFNVPADILEKK